MVHICFGLAKATWPLVQENDNEIPFQKQGRSAEQPVHIRSGAFLKAIRYGTYYFWNQSVLGHNCHKSRAKPIVSSANRRPIRYGFRVAPIIDPIYTSLYLVALLYNSYTMVDFQTLNCRCSPQHNVDLKTTLFLIENLSLYSAIFEK